MRETHRVRDGLALSGALPDRSLLAMVAAMSLLAALTLTGAIGAKSLSERWATGAGNLVTVQVPDPDRPAALSGSPGHTAGESRAQAVLASLTALPALTRVHRLDDGELQLLLKPWLGTSDIKSLPLPAVIEVDLASGHSLPDDLFSTLDSEAPGTLIERNDSWRQQLHVIARSLLLCAWAAIALVGLIAAAVIGMATRLGLGARRESVTILHELGASDAYVAHRFGQRIALLSFFGGLAGAAVSLTPIAVLSRLMAPLAGVGPLPATSGWGQFVMSSLGGFLDGSAPCPLLVGLAAIPFTATLLGWLTAQAIVRIWLRRLP